MRIAFAGTPSFAASCLEALLAARHEVCLVLTQPDRPSGRGLRPAEGAVKKLAQRHGLQVIQPVSLRELDVSRRLAESSPRVLVVAAYGLILPGDILSVAPLGAVNVHASLLPRWRGAAPIQRAILEGDRETGITIMQMDAGLDTGPILTQRSLAILPDDNAQLLQDRLADLGSKMIVEALSAIETGRIHPRPQPVEGVLHAPKISVDESVLDWRRPADMLERQVRALSPQPGARTHYRGGLLKVWRSQVASGSGAPGLVLDSGRDGILVACGARALRLTELQRAGSRRLSASEFLRGCPVTTGDQLELPSLEA